MARADLVQPNHLVEERVEHLSDYLTALATVEFVRGREVSRHSKSHVLRWLNGPGGVPWGANPADFDADAVTGTLSSVGRLFGEEAWPRRYFPLDVQGMEHVPQPPVMIVSNHSGGTTIPDVWGFLVAWYRHFGVERPIHPLAHEMIVSTPLIGPYFAKRGILRATNELARTALQDFRRDIMVMPGGDLETWRPWRRRFEVDFGGRRGYARLAIQTGTPIVPVAHAGAHDTFMVLTDGRKIARFLHLDAFARAQVFPVSLALPWGLAIGPLPHIPIPARLHYRIGAPVVPPAIEPGSAPTDEQVRAMDSSVRGAIQSMLDQLKSA